MDNVSLVADLVEWAADRPRGYDDAMAAWRTSCPRLTIWEDAIDGGLISVSFDGGANKVVKVTTRGRRFLENAGRC